MKHLKKFEKNKEEIHYKIPSYPLEVYFIALTKVGMTPDEISKWSNNKLAQYWNNPGIKFIHLNHSLIYNSWSWSNNTNEYKNIIEITVEDYEIEANKFNI